MCVGERIKEGVQWCETHEMAWGWYDCIAHERQSVNQVCSSFLELNILHFKEKDPCPHVLGPAAAAREGLWCLLQQERLQQ